MRRGLICLAMGMALGCSDGDSTAAVTGPAAGIGGAPAAGAGTAGVTPADTNPPPAPGTPSMDTNGAVPVMPVAGQPDAAGQGAMPAPEAGSMADGTAGSTAGEGPEVPGGDETPVADPPPTCAANLPGQAGDETVRLQHDGLSRNYILHVPSSYSSDSPVPLVLYFHPLLTNATTAATSSGFRELADREGFVVAFPDSAQSAAWNVGGICCTSSPDIDDVGFARAVVDDIESKYCVDDKRIYASGFSMGGGMTHHLGCEAADVFAAIAPGSFDLFEESDCAPVRPITVISFRGTADIIVPFAGAMKTSAPNGFVGTHTFEGAEGTFDRWAQIDGCTDQPVDEGGGCKTHKECSEGVEVTLCVTTGGSHTWPDAERAWQTLSRFSLP